jgi:hypothetical protein
VSKDDFPIPIPGFMGVEIVDTEDLSKFRNEADYFWHTLIRMSCEKQTDPTYYQIVAKMRRYRDYRKNIDALALIDDEGL